MRIDLVMENITELELEALQDLLQKELMISRIRKMEITKEYEEDKGIRGR